MASDGLALFRERFDAVRPNWDSRRGQYRENYEQCLSESHVPDGRYGCQVKTQYTPMQVMTYTDFAVATLMPAYPWVYARGYEPARAFEDAATEEFNARLEEVNFFWKCRLWFRLAAMYGVGVAKLTWGDRGIDFRLVNPANLAWDPGAENLRESADWVIEEVQDVPVSRAITLAHEGVYDLGAVRRITGQSNDAESLKQEEMRTRNAESPILMPPGPDARLILHEMVERDRIVTVHEPSGIVLRDKPNPYKRIYYYDVSPYPEVFQIQGYSIPEMLRDIQDEKDTNRRQRTDAYSLVCNPMLKMRRSSGLSPHGQRCGPGKVWMVNDLDDIDPIQFQTGVAEPLLREEQILQDEGDQLLGVNVHNRGASGPDMKATVANIMATSNSIRLSIAMNAVQDYPFRPFLADFQDLCQVYEKPAAATQAEWGVISRAVDMGLMRLKFRSEAHVGNEFAKAQLLQQFAGLFFPLLLPPGQAELAKYALTLLQMPDPERVAKWLIGSPEMLAQMGMGTPAAPGGTQGRGTGMTEETARAAAPGQAPMSKAVGM